jgi:transcriptional accessory protein Tex/SPT6
VIRDVALQGARDIIAEWINENIMFVNSCDAFIKEHTVSTKVVKKQKKKKKHKSFINISIGQNH